MHPAEDSHAGKLLAERRADAHWDSLIYTGNIRRLFPTQIAGGLSGAFAHIVCARSVLYREAKEGSPIAT